MERTTKRWRRGVLEDGNGGWETVVCSINCLSSWSPPGQLTHRELLVFFFFFFPILKYSPLSALNFANIWFQDHERQGVLSAKKGLLPKA